MAGKLAQIERPGALAAVVDFPTRDLGIPGSGHECLRGKLHVKGRAEKDRITCECPKRNAVIMSKVPRLGANGNGRSNAIGQRSRDAEFRLILPGAEIDT